MAERNEKVKNLSESLNYIFWHQQYLSKLENIQTKSNENNEKQIIMSQSNNEGELNPPQERGDPGVESVIQQSIVKKKTPRPQRNIKKRIMSDLSDTRRRRLTKSEVIQMAIKKQPLRKSTTKNNNNKKRKEKKERDIWVPITLQMILQTLDRVHRKDGSTICEMITNMRKYYPINPIKNQLMKDLRFKLKCATDMGLIHRNSRFRFFRCPLMTLKKEFIRKFWNNCKMFKIRSNHK